MRDRILTYLSQGLKPVQVASIVGVTASYISQLLKEASFVEALNAKRAELKVSLEDEDKALTNKYLSLEHRLLDSIETAMGFAELPAIVRALEVVGNRQEKRLVRLATPLRVPGEANSPVVVNITLPSHAIPEYSLSNQKEVIAVGGKEIVPLSSEGVKHLFHDLAEKRKEEAIKAAEERKQEAIDGSDF